MNSRFQTCIYHDEDTLTGNECAGDKDRQQRKHRANCETGPFLTYRLGGGASPSLILPPPHSVIFHPSLSVEVPF